MYLSINSNSKSQFEVDLEFIHFREKYTMKRPQMKGWTVCGILKNRFILEINTQCSAQKWGGGRFAAFLKNRFITQLYWEMKFIRKSQSCITLREKILCPRKKWNMNKNIFSKIERPGFGGVDSLRHFTKMMWILKILSITGKKWFFQNILFQKYPLKTALDKWKLP